MKKNHLYSTAFMLCLLITLCPGFIFAQSNNGVIKGIITTADNKPAENISIMIEPAKRGTITDEKGKYTISRLAPGNYVLKISSVGLTAQQKEISVVAGQTVEENFIINITSEQLEDVIVNMQQNKFSAAASNDVAKMPLKNIENPQVYTIVTGALLKDQLTVDYSDALKNVPGVIMQLENNTAGGSVTSRGFPTQSFLRNGVVGVAGDGAIDVSNIESIEAIKGPSGALYGSSLISYGGLFNIVTKKPFDTYNGVLSYTWGGYGLSRFTADINTPLNTDKTLLFRMNAAIHHEGSWQDGGFASYEFIAPSLTYKI
ncbi:MAG TPA: TonB-dependent receptor, partial [Arachidicoccus sp.]